MSLNLLIGLAGLGILFLLGNNKKKAESFAADNPRNDDVVIGGKEKGGKLVFRPVGPPPTATPRVGGLKPEERAQYYTFTPVTQEDINAFLRDNPLNQSKRPLVYNYPGFTRRPDGLLQWDGRTIPPGYANVIATAQTPRNCSPDSEQLETGRMTVEECKAQEIFPKWILYCLQNRPWYPGEDISSLLGPNREQDHYREQFRRFRASIGAGDERQRGDDAEGVQIPDYSAMRYQTRLDTAARPKPIPTIAEANARRTIGSRRSAQASQAAKERSAQSRALVERAKQMEAGQNYNIVEVFLGEFVG